MKNIKNQRKLSLNTETLLRLHELAPLELRRARGGLDRTGTDGICRPSGGADPCNRC